jgi:rare lipoprotein A
MRSVCASFTITAALLISGIYSNAEAARLFRGMASYYGFQSETASGETMNPKMMTAAHRTLPFGTRVRVTDVITHRSVIVRINDRGPFITDFIIDLSTAAAQALGIIGQGVAMVDIEVLP